MDTSKLVLIVVAVLAVLSLPLVYGLGKDRSPEAQLVERIVENVGASQERGEYAVANTTLTVHSAALWQSDNQFMNPKSGKSFYAVDVSLTNTGEGWYNLGPFQFKLRDTEGRDYTIGLSGPSPQLSSRQMNAGDTVRGYLCFEVLESAQVSGLVWAGKVFAL